jgi:cobalt-zinc-cadmium efflux system outer membrane protein
MLISFALWAPALPTPSSAQNSYTLEELLQIGRERNPELLALRAERAALDADRRDAGRFMNPEVGYSTGEGDLFEEREKKSLRELSVRQAIENPLVRHHRMSALKRGVEAADEGVRFGALGVEYQIRLHYYRILYLQELLTVARLNEEALDEVRQLIESRAAVGEVRELEAIRLRVEHMRARNAVSEVELELAQFRQHLNMFLGEALPEDYLLEGNLSADLTVPAFDSLKEEILPQHPLLRQAARERVAAEAQLKASQYSWIPGPVLSATSAKELDGDIFLWGVGFEIPLWNQSRAATQRERETLRQMEHHEVALLLDLQAELMVHHNHLLLHRQLLGLFQEGLLEEADVSMEIAETSYREGEISLVEYLDARRTYQSIQVEYQQALYDWNRELTELDRAAGGGIL